MVVAGGDVTVGIVVAGGTAERFGREGGKQLLYVAGRSVLSRSAESIARAESVSHLVVVCHPERVEEYRIAVGDVGSTVPTTFVAGGAVRQQSVENGLVVAESLGAYSVVIHDGARPLVESSLVDQACSVLRAEPSLDGVIVGYPVTDTLKIALADTIDSTPDRSKYWAVQTPQVFRVRSLRAAIDAAADSGFLGTDDASLVERNGGTVRLIVGPRDNIKITVAEDAAIAEAILAWKTGS